MYLVDYHVHFLGHGHHRQEPAEISRYLETAIGRGIREIGAADHDRYRDQYHWETMRETASGFKDISLRLGIEIEYRPPDEDRLRSLIAGLPDPDYVIGSVHFLGDWNFDHPAERDQYQAWDPTELYREYFRVVAQAARTGLFQIVGHLDLIKIYGVRPPGPVAPLAEEALEAIAAAGLVIELNAAGLHKPVQEIYPSLELLQACHRRGIPITLSSDAHHPEEAGRDVDRAATLAWEAGYRQVAAFRGRERFFHPL